MLFPNQFWLNQNIGNLKMKLFGPQNSILLPACYCLLHFMWWFFSKPEIYQIKNIWSTQVISICVVINHLTKTKIW